MRIIKFFVIFLIIFGWIFSGWPQIFNFPPKIQYAQAAVPTYKGSGTFTAVTTAAMTPPYPTGGLAPAANDICLLVIETENQAISLSSAQGFVEASSSPQFAGTAATDPANRIAVFWKRAVGGDTAPTSAAVGNHQTGQIHCFSGVITSGLPWDVTSGGNDNGVNRATSTIPGATTAVDGTLVVLIQGNSRNGTGTANCSAWTNANLANLTERTDNTNTAGLGGGHCMATGEKATAGAYASTTVTLSAVSYKGVLSIALKPQPTTILGDGTNPPGKALIPGATATSSDIFTFRTDSGTESITNVTTTLAGTGQYAGISKVEIVDEASTTVYGSVTNPSTDAFSISLTGLTASTATSTLQIRITPFSHTDMPSPPGALYTVTSTITAWTGASGNTQAGNDSGSATITIDNLSPSDVTNAISTPSDMQVIVNWTNPGGGEHHNDTNRHDWR